MNIGDYLKRKMAMLSLALSKVEKSTLNEESGGFDSNSLLSQTMNQGTMADALLKGEISSEVRDLRWRTYKILNASENLKTKVVGYDDDGLPITETTSYEKDKLNKIILDSHDDYKAELVIPNDEVKRSTHEEWSNDKLKTLKDSELKSYKDSNEKYDLVGTESDDNRTLGEISFDDMLSSMKTDREIIIHRSLKPKFEIESYTKKLVVRNIDDKNKLLEFYISKYPDEYDRKSRLLISELKKIMKNPRSTNILDIDKVGFITNKAIGVNNGLEFIYEVVEFDKIIEFNGHYVLKFVAKPIVNGVSIFDKYREDGLEERYRNKESKKQAK